MYKVWMDVTITQQPELRIAGIRHIGPYMNIGREFGRLGGMLKGAPPKGAQMIAVYYDDPATTAADQLRADAAVTLPGSTSAPMGLIERRVPAGKYAKAIHNGSYQGLPAAWGAVREWAKKNGHSPAHPGYEIYLNTPMDTSENDLRTEIFMKLD
jgi:AraC family transcriptional regulator